MTDLVYERNFEVHGLSVSHRAILSAVPHGSRVLDVGCATGYLGAELRRRNGCTVHGLDVDAGAVEVARARGVDAEQLDLERESFNAEGFDVVVFGDVLEHLRDPCRVLSRAHPAPTAIVSLPNIGHWTARVQHMRGRWPQEDSGLFDRTHLHFYTPETMRELVSDAGWAVARERYTKDRLPLERVVPRRLGWASSRAQQRAADLLPSLFAFQVVMTLVPATP
jgi:methionine biosynthesis protein MetW